MHLLVCLSQWAGTRSEAVGCPWCSAKALASIRHLTAFFNEQKTEKWMKALCTNVSD